MVIVLALVGVGAAAAPPAGVQPGGGDGPGEPGAPERLASTMTLDEALSSAALLEGAERFARAGEVLREALGALERGEGIDEDAIARARLDEGRAWIRAGRTEEAVAALRLADLGASGREVRSAARFLVGQAWFREVMAEVEEAEQTGMRAGIDVLTDRAARMTRAASAFRSVLEVDPSDAAAARNVERARRLISGFEEEAQQEAQRQQQMQELQEALEALADEQEQRADDTQGSEDTESLNEDQQETSENTEQARQQGQQAGANESVQEAIDRAREQQEQAEAALERGDREEAEERQRDAAEALREAAARVEEQRQEGEASDENAEQSGSPQEQESEGEGEPEEEGEPRDETAEALLERERRQREQRDQRRSSTGQPVIVERDW